MNNLNHKMRVFVGKRGTGKSTALSSMIGDGTGTLIIASTEKDVAYHRAASPRATVLLDTDITTVVMDNAEIAGATILPHIAAVNHPCAVSRVPREVTGSLVMLCTTYVGVDRVMDELRQRFDIVVDEKYKTFDVCTKGTT